MKTSQENEKFCADLESYVQLYNQKSSGLSQGLSFYSEFSFRVNDVYQKAHDFIMAREIEKNDLIKNINNGTHGGNSNIINSFADISLLNPSTNVITNMDYQYQYNYMPSNNVQYYENSSNQNKSNTHLNQNSSQQGQNFSNYNFQTTDYTKKNK